MTSLLAAALLLACRLAAAQPTVSVKGLDVYRSQAVTAEGISSAAREELMLFLRLRSENRRGSEESIQRAKAALEAKIRGLGALSSARVYYGEYSDGKQKTAYITVDAVDAADVGSRLAFSRAPAGRASDPGGALDLWRRYSDLGESLFRQGQLSLADRPECPGLYCSYGSSTPDLAALEKKLLAAAATHKDELRAAAANDADPRRRAAAVFALSYNPDGKAVVDSCLAALRDPSEDVRSAALQVLADVALYHKSFFIDAGRVIPVLDDPSTAVRAKALAVISGLSGSGSYRTFLASRAAPALLGLLRLLQPANHDLAYTALATLSQQSYGERDYAAWERWVETHASSAAATAGVTAQPLP